MLGVEHQLARDIETVRAVNGLFVGLLDESEVDAFNRLCQRGIARRAYSGASQLLGLAKVEIDADA